MRRAADALGVLHATLSHRLRDLEEEVGVALFFRSNKGVKLTKAGQDFLRRIRRVFNEKRWFGLSEQFRAFR
ncbi:LysR family transcriptional regulator [Brucella pecoris]